MRIKVIITKRLVDKDSYFLTHAWMTNELNLQHIELSVFAMIFGFCRDGQGNFSGSRRYLAELCNCSLKSVDIALKKLVKKQLIIKDVEYDKYHQKKCIYTVDFEKINELVEKSTQSNNYSGMSNSYSGVRNNYSRGRVKSTHNNIDKNNSNKNNNNTLSDDDGEVKNYGRFGNVKLSEYWYDYLILESEEWVDEYINRLDMHIEKKGLQNMCNSWPPKKFGLTILDWMRRDGVTSD